MRCFALRSRHGSQRRAADLWSGQFFGASVSNRRSDVLSGCISAHQGAGVAMGGLSAFRTRRSCGRRRSGSAGRRHSARNEPPRHGHHRCRARCHARTRVAQTQNRKENGESSLGCGCCTVGNLCVSGWRYPFGPRHQCSVPHRLDRLCSSPGGDPNPCHRGPACASRRELRVRLSPRIDGKSVKFSREPSLIRDSRSRFQPKRGELFSAEEHRRIEDDGTLALL